MKRKLAWWIFALAVCACLVTLAHSFVFSLVEVSGDGFQPTLLRGDRIYVNRWSYGLRAPFSDHQGYKRWFPRKVHRGEWLAFNTPATEPSEQPDTTALCLGMVMAQPADTVWMGRGAHVSPVRRYAHGQIWPLVVPSKGAYLKIHPWDAELYAQMLRQHEGVEATVRTDSLYINGKYQEFCRFSQDYYWVSSQNDSNLLDSRTFGFVPERCIMGRMEMVVYSLDGLRPRWKRSFKPL